jgi:hypothetical protein
MGHRSLELHYDESTLRALVPVLLAALPFAHDASSVDRKPIAPALQANGPQAALVKLVSSRTPPRARATTWRCESRRTHRSRRCSGRLLGSGLQQPCNARARQPRNRGQGARGALQRKRVGALSCRAAASTADKLNDASPGPVPLEGEARVRSGARPTALLRR